jgi:hypothetical protein
VFVWPKKDEGEMGAGSEVELCSSERSKLLRPSTYEDC